MAFKLGLLVAQKFLFYANKILRIKYCDKNLIKKLCPAFFPLHYEEALENKLNSTFSKSHLPYNRRKKKLIFD